MALIPQDELATLKNASDVKTVALSAAEDAEKMAIAKLINSSANTGQMEVLYNHEISESVITALEGLGYTVNKLSPKVSADPKYQYTISWKE